jgi:hypothetical protein
MQLQGDLYSYHTTHQTTLHLLNQESQPVVDLLEQKQQQ